MPIYTVYLSSYTTSPTSNQGVPTNNTNQNNVTWNLNFDDIFRMENHKHRRCRLRIKLQSASWGAVSTDWDTYLGYLTCNLPSITGGFGSYGTVIAPVTATETPTGGHAAGTSLHCIVIDTTSEPGVDIVVPTGNSDFRLTFNRKTLDSGLRISNVYEYQVFLYFELYDEIKAGF